MALYARALTAEEILRHYYVATGQLLADCNKDGMLDAAEIAAGITLDCNGNFVPDECDISGGTSADVDDNGTPDECFPPYAAAVLADDPIGYWRLGERFAGMTAVDDANNPSAPQSGSQDGDYESGVELGQAGFSAPQFPGFGSANLAPRFGNGNGAIALVDVFGVLDTLRPAQITMEAWINNESLLGRQVIYKNHIWQLVNGFAIYLEGNRIEVAARSTPSDGQVPQPASAPFDTIGQWRHVVGVVDYANDEMRVYIDGQLGATMARSFGQSAYSPPGPPPTVPDFIGRVTEGFAFDGLIDEVALYNRALSDAEISEHYMIAVCGKKGKAGSARINR